MIQFDSGCSSNRCIFLVPLQVFVIARVKQISASTKKMNLRQMLVFLMMVSIIRGGVIQNERNRTKRTLHYFLNGIYSALNQEKRLAAARVSNEQKSSSAISILSKLSSFSTRPKSFNALGDDAAAAAEEDDNSLLLGNTNQKTFSQMQLPIPTMRPVKVDTLSNQSVTQLSLLPSTTRIPSTTSTTTPKSSKIESSKSTSQESGEKSNEIVTSAETTQNPNELTTTMESNEYETTIEDSSTMESASGTASDDDTETTTVTDLEVVLAKNNNINDTQPKRPLYSEIHPFSMSNRHTTQSFGSPLIVERHQNEEQSPMYLDNCAEINCLDDAENSKEVRPYIVPANFHQHNALLIIPFAYAVHPTSDRTRSNQKRLHDDPNYVWSQNGQPIMHIKNMYIQV